MQIDRLKLRALNLDALREFYVHTLGLALVGYNSKTLEIRAGDTKIVFNYQKDSDQGVYHIAFNIPENSFDRAKKWLEARTPLRKNREGEDKFHFENWNAHGVYFHDPDGNILELIARHSLGNATDKPFDSSQLLCVSEIGVATHDVPDLVEQIQAEMDIAVYGNASDEFTAVGDENGMIIVVKAGREWFPASSPELFATQLPVEADIYNQAGDGFRFSNLSYSAAVACI